METNISKISRRYLRVPEGTRRYAAVPDVPDHLGYLHPEFKVSVVREWYAVVCSGTWRYPMVHETFDRELRRYMKVREGTQVAP